MMKKYLLLTVLSCLMFWIQCAAEQKTLETPTGVPAPDFSVKDVSGNRITSADLKGKSVVLVFYVNNN